MACKNLLMGSWGWQGINLIILPRRKETSQALCTSSNWWLMISFQSTSTHSTYRNLAKKRGSTSENPFLTLSEKVSPLRRFSLSRRISTTQTTVKVSRLVTKFQQILMLGKTLVSMAQPWSTTRSTQLLTLVRQHS